MYAPRINETTTSTGTTNVTLAGSAGTGLNTFFSEFGTTGIFAYAIVSRTAAEWEEGLGYLSNSTTLIRHIVLRSSNSDSLVNFSAGTKDVFNHLPSGLIGNGQHAIAQPAARMHFGV